ncbi:MAG TPA: hypothetical protein VJ852_12140 [Gemmatimonadaceae bacterium]|nr:hypothetical protein [Gemmatimonadaceae bacterium]
MISRRILISIVACLACERSAPTQRSTTSSSTTQTSATQIAPPEQDPLIPYYAIVAPDSAVGSWEIYSPELPQAAGFFSGNAVRHPSGVMTIWFDTAIRATEDHPVLRAHADSLVVSGLSHLEYLAPICMNRGQNPIGNVVGLVTESDTSSAPRLAWKLNVRTFRIEQFPVDNLACIFGIEGDED